MTETAQLDLQRDYCEYLNFTSFFNLWKPHLCTVPMCLKTVFTTKNTSHSPKEKLVSCIERCDLSLVY